MIATIERSSLIRKASAATTNVAPMTAETTTMTAAMPGMPARPSVAGSGASAGPTIPWTKIAAAPAIAAASDGPDRHPRDGGEAERALAPAEQHDQGRRLEPGRDRDREGDAGQAVGPDEDDRRASC